MTPKGLNSDVGGGQQPACSSCCWSTGQRTRQQRRNAFSTRQRLRLMVNQWRPKSQLLWSMDSITWPTWLNRFATFDHNIQLVHSLKIRSGFLVPGFSKCLVSGFPFLVLCFHKNQGASWEEFGCPWTGEGTTSCHRSWRRPNWACRLASSPVPQDGSSICHCEGQVTTWCSKLDNSFPFDFAYCSIYQGGKILMQDLMVLW